MKKNIFKYCIFIFINIFTVTSNAETDVPKLCADFLNSKTTVIYNNKPKDLPALMGKAKAQYEEGHLLFTIELLKSILNQFPEDYKAMGFLSQTYFRTGNLTKALEYQKKAQSLEPEYRITTDLALAQILIALKRFSETEVHFNRAFKHDPNNSFALGLKIRMFLDMAKFNYALEKIRKKLELDNKDLNALLYLAEYNFKQGRFNDALEVAYHLLGIKPSEDMGIFKLKKRDIIGLALRAKILSVYSHSESDLRMALKDVKLLQKNFSSVPVWLLYLRAEIEDKLSLPRDAQQTLLRIVKAHKPNHIMALAGLVHLEKRGYTSANQDILTAAFTKLTTDEVMYVMDWSKDFTWSTVISDNAPAGALTFSMDFWNGIHLIPLKY